MAIFIKRIYSEASAQDGLRVLIDRLWPRGVKKEEAKIDIWAKDLTPSNALRTWFHEDMEQHWDEFQQKYQQELENQTAQLDKIRSLAQEKDITLITAAQDKEKNHALVLKKILERR
ncbi:DUF488 family protein [Acinetobacter bohemicus]|uniref:DUF488 domain-containing protein n=1 Tax=Acinetobacter TaxID=469 RepID=UPI00209BB218|nr:MULTISPECIES: DUF488 family protein [Acinetobacter]MCO8042677.1 DUF488 family protein [Acinetobacter sp. S4400-12]MCU7224842.1 DUF488 family protein [Acinetobacter bohemicus]